MNVSHKMGSTLRRHKHPWKYWGLETMSRTT